MGSVFKRGETWWIQYYHNGKRIRESARTNKKTVADRFLKLREGKIAEGRIPGFYFDKITFEELAEALIEDYEINGKRSTSRAKLSVDRHLRPYFGGMRATQITTPYIEKYKRHRLGEGAANASINRELSALKRMFNLGARQTPPKVDRVPYIPMLDENNKREGFFEHDEFLRLREALPVYLRGVVTFAYKTGCRRGEILNLKWTGVDRKEGRIRLEGSGTKNKETRTFFVDEELRGILRQQFANRRTDCPYVFYMDGQQIGRFDKTWKTACKKVVIPGRLFHDFRRTAIRNMMRQGHHERVVMAVSGHKTREVFDRYNIVSEEDLKLVVTRRAR